AGIPVAVLEMHAARATPSGPAGAQTPRQVAPGARTHHAVAESSRAAPTPARPSHRSPTQAPTGRLAPAAGPPRSELESTAAGEAMSGAAAPKATRDGSGAPARLALTAPPTAVSP